MKIGKLLWVSATADGMKKHNAFTDIKYFCEDDKESTSRGYKGYYMAFRTGNNHIDKRDGEIKVFVSSNGDKWFPSPFQKMEGDMRDPHFFYYKGRPAIIFALVNNETPAAYISLLDKDGEMWEKPFKFMDEFVAWRPLNHNGHLFVPGFHHGKEAKKTKMDIPGVCLQKMGSRVYVDGKLEIIDDDPSSNETEIFEYEGELYAIVRVESRYAKLFKRIGGKWKFQKSCGYMLQGPCVNVARKRIFVVGRETSSIRDYLDNRDKIFEYLVLRELDLKKGEWISSNNFIQGINLDTGYAGLEIVDDKRLLMSMYAGNQYGSNVFIFEVEI